MKFSAERKAKVMIVDDHPIIRQGMSLLINREPDMAACCQAEQIDEAVQANRACPHDIVILDMSLEGFSGLELLRRMKFEFPDLPVLILSMHDEAIYAEPALRAGAQGYLMKQVATESLLQAIRQVLKGELYVSDQLRSRILRKMVNGAKSESPVSELSPSELEVLHLIGMGLGTSEIAEKLSRSVKTIESHKANMKKKLNLESGTQLTHFAINLVSSGNV